MRSLGSVQVKADSGGFILDFVQLIQVFHSETVDTLIATHLAVFLVKTAL